MKRHIPPRPTGFDREAVFDQAVWDALFGPSGQIIDSSTVRANRTTQGISFHAKPSKGGGLSSIDPYYVVEHHEEYTLCSPFDGTQPSGEATIKIAKPWELRYSVTSETLDSINFAYSLYSLSAQSRLATWSAGTETQYIVPRYRFGSIIAAFACSKTGVEGATFLELSARAWSAP